MPPFLRTCWAMKAAKAARARHPAATAEVIAAKTTTKAAAKKKAPAKAPAKRKSA